MGANVWKREIQSVQENIYPPLYSQSLSLTTSSFPFFLPNSHPFYSEKPPTRNALHTPFPSFSYTPIYTSFPRPCLEESPPPPQKCGVGREQRRGGKGEKSSTDSSWSCKQRAFDHIFSHEPILVFSFCFFFYKSPCFFAPFCFLHMHIGVSSPAGGGGEGFCFFFVFHPFLRVGGGSWGLLVD